MKKYESKILNDFFEIKDKVGYEKTLAKMTIAKKISEGMAKQKLGKKELALAMKKYPSEVTKWISGGHNFTIDTLIELQNILKIKLIY